MDDRRQQPRYELTKKVRAKVEAGDGANRQFEAWYTTVDVSAGGVFIQGGALLKEGTSLKLTLLPEDREQGLVVNGSVAHTREQDANAGMGVRFIAADASLLDSLLSEG